MSDNEAMSFDDDIPVFSNEQPAQPVKTKVQRKPRKGIPKKIRFEVLKRDSFKCQYCGATAPDVVLHIDHISPVSKGGGNDIMNLITSCEACNLGKSDKELTDKSSIEKQRKQLEELSEKREQLQMMIKWRNELSKMDDDIVNSLVEHIELYMGDMTVSDVGKRSIKKWLKTFTFDEIYSAIDETAERVLKGITNDREVIEQFFMSIPKTASFKKQPEDRKQLLYIRGILRNRLNYINEKMCMSLLNHAIEKGVQMSQLSDFAKTVKNWTTFKAEIEGL
ncbi:MAG: HNH endonuclease [Tolumonas sp.]|nr:HNH endonuclease [Tolumonas sp.]